MENELKDFINEVVLWESILDALESFFKTDNILIEYKIHEQAITHRLWVYLEHQNLLFHEDNKEILYHIDCEYNKNWKWIKQLDCSNPEDIFYNEVLYKIYNNDQCNRLLSEKWKKTYFSDSKKSLFIIEDFEDVKKSYVVIWTEKYGKVYLWNKSCKLKSYCIRPDIIIHERWTSNNLCVFEVKIDELESEDKLKLQAFTSDKFVFGYKHWIWLFNFKNDTVNIDLYQNGEIKGEFIYKKWVWIKKKES